MRAKTPATRSAFCFRKLIFSKKFARPCPPPLDHGPPPWTPRVANVEFSALPAKIRENHPIVTRNSAIFGYDLSVFQAKVSFLGSSLNAVVVFNAKRAA